MKRLLMRFRLIDKLIQGKVTGSPAELAAKIGIAERTIYEYIKTMKKLGAPILYSRSTKSYLYDFEGGFKISFIKI